MLASFILRFSLICSAIVTPGCIASSVVDDASLAEALSKAETSQCNSDVAGDAHGNCKEAEALELLQTRAKGVASTAMPDEDRKRNEEWMKMVTRNYEKTGDADTEKEKAKAGADVVSDSALSASAQSLVEASSQGPWHNLTYNEDGEPDELAVPGGWGEAAEQDAKIQHLNAQGQSAGNHHYHRRRWQHRRRWHKAHSPSRHRWAAPPSFRQVLTLYHQTGAAVGPLILAHGFRLGSQGWCGGGIYFATSPQATENKAIGPDSHKGFMIEARVDVGNVKLMPRHCDRSMSAGRIHSEGFDSIRFNPGDGDEVVVYSPSRVLSVRRIPWR